MNASIFEHAVFCPFSPVPTGKDVTSMSVCTLNTRRVGLSSEGRYTCNNPASFPRRIFHDKFPA